MKVTVTGGTGLLGSNLAIQLTELGHQVRCIRRKSSRINHLDDFPIDWVEADLHQADSLYRAFSNTDIVFHCAAQVSIARHPTSALIKSNVDGTRNVLNAVRRCKVKRLVHCSTVAAIAVSENGTPVTEKNTSWNLDKFGMADGYAITKRESQNMVVEAAANDIDAVIVNPTFMFGPYDRKPSSGKLIIDVLNRRIPGFTDGFHNYVDVRDVCRGMIAAAEKGTRGELYILGNLNLSYREIFERIATIGGIKPTNFRLPRLLALMLGRFGDLQEKLTGREVLLNSVAVRWVYNTGCQFSSEKAERELGYQPGSLDSGIRDAISWFRQENMLN